MPERPSMLKPALIGGSSAGFAAGLPMVGALNCACCALIVAGGFLASFLYSKACANAGVEFRAGKGAGLGLFAGLFYAVVSTVVSAIFNRVDADAVDRMMEALDRPDIPPEFADGFVRFMELIASPIGILIAFLIGLVLASIFSTLGGLIGGSVFKVEAAPPSSAGPAAPPATGV
jgi:tetrahydromethanopterin S-methyltransferase subunit G